MFFSSSEIWSDKLKRLYNKAHRATERTEIKAMSRRCRWHKEWRRCSVQISDNPFGMNALYINCWQNWQTISVALRTDGASVPTGACFDIPPYSPFLCVTSRQRPKLRRIIITPKFLRPYFLLRKDKNGNVKKIVNACLVDTELLTSILANTEERM